METEKKVGWGVKCFWVCAVVVALVFLIPVEKKEYESGGVRFEFSYTLYDKIVGNGPKEKGQMYIDGKKYR